MKVKEIERTGNAAWSAASQYPIYLAVGTAAQQLDASFSTSAALEIYSVNLAEPGYDMNIVGALPTSFRFHKLVWGPTDGNPTGLLVGGADQGKISVWNPTGLISGEESADDALVHTMTKHTGAVLSLDINPFQKNLLASGASDSEIFIWDMNKPDNPMTPGTKSQPPDDVSCVAWNRQVQHILASTYSGRCIVWDLRKNEPIIKVSDSMSRIKSKLVEWHPEVATQLCLSSEDDHTPVIQLWDLRFATSPLKVLEHHQRGVLSMAWCPQDPDLLLSCGKDNHILCWNPNSSNTQPAEVVYELNTSSQWCFDVKWCPRNPALISTCSFDGHVSVYSLMGGTSTPQTSSKVVDAFPSDPFAAPLIQPTAQPQTSTPMIKKVPKWLRRPSGASFAFGGKLVVFENVHKSPQQQQQAQVQAVAPQRLVSIRQVVTETDLVERSRELEHALTSGTLAEFCDRKIGESANNELDANIWRFMKVHFEKDPRSKYLELLGHDKRKLAKALADSGELKGEDKALENGLSGTRIDDHTDDLVGGVDASAEGDAAFDKIAAKTDHGAALPISTGDGYEGLVTRALLSADFESAVNLCFNHGRLAEAVLLAVAGGQDLLTRTQRRFFTTSKDSLNKLISCIVTRDFDRLIVTCELKCWGEALAAILTYAKPDEFARLADMLGARLEASDDAQLAANASLCYVCSGNVDRLVDCIRLRQQEDGGAGTSVALQDLMEKVMVLRRSLEVGGGRGAELGVGSLAHSVAHYAELLAAQGSLHTALTYLGASTETTVAVLRHRLYRALGGTAGSGAPALPFAVVDVRAAPAAPVNQQPAAAANQLRAGGVQQHGQRSFEAQMGGGAAGRVPNQGMPYQPADYGRMAGGVSAAAAGPYGGKAAASAPLNLFASVANPYVPASTNPHAPAPTNLYAPASVPAPRAPTMASGYGQPVASQPNAPLVQNVLPYEDRPKGGWNDTPAIRPKQQTAQPIQTPAPIMYPTPVGAAGAMQQSPPQPIQPQQPMGPGYLGGQQQQRQLSNYPAVQTQPMYGGAKPGAGSAYPGAYQPAAPAYTDPHSQPGYQPASLYNPQEHQPQQQPVATVKPVEPAKPIIKADIPKEHIIIQEVFDKLVEECKKHANNVANKKKLEEVGKKLEILYDSLRDNALSQAVLQGLHQVIQAVQAFDYQTALAWHTHLVSQGNFSEISSFMPSVKMLLQTAAQHNVYIGQ